MFIKNANQQPAIKLAGGIEKFIEAQILSAWGQLPPIDWANPVGYAPAYILRSSWVVGCPFCSDTHFTYYQATFFCPSCLMGENSGKAVRVYFPKEWEEIQDTLVARPNPMNRNWLINETLKDLLFENEIHGVN